MNKSIKYMVYTFSILMLIALGLSFKTQEEKDKDDEIWFKEYSKVEVEKLDKQYGNELWSHTLNTNRNNTLENSMDLNLATSAIQIAYSNLSDSQLDFIFEYYRSIQIVCEQQTNNIPPWLLVGYNSYIRGDIEIEQGIRVPYAGIKPNMWNKDYKDTKIDFINSNEDMIYSIDNSYILNNPNYEGIYQQPIEDFIKNKVIGKSKSDNNYNLYVDNYTLAKSISDNYQLLSDIQYNNEPDVNTFADLDDNMKWVLSALMSYKDNSMQVIDNIKVMNLERFSNELNKLYKDRYAFDEYTDAVYNGLWDNNKKMLYSLMWFMNVNEYKTNSQTMIDSISNLFKNDIEPLNDINTYDISVDTFDITERNSLDNIIFKNNSILCSNDVDFLMHVLYMGKYYSGIGSYIVQKENSSRQKLVSNNTSLDTLINVNEPMGLMYYWQYAKMKSLNGKVVTDNKLLKAFDSYNNKQIPIDKYNKIDINNVSPHDIFGDIYEVGWKGPYPIFRQNADDIKNNKFWKDPKTGRVSTMGNSACSVYTFVSMLYGLNLERQPIPNWAGEKNNGLNQYGYIDPERIGTGVMDKGVTLSMDNVDVLKVLGYDIEEINFSVNNMQEYLINLERLYSNLRKGIPYAITTGNYKYDLYSYWGDFKKASYTDGGHYILLAYAREVNGKRYIEVVNCSAGNGNDGDNDYIHGKGSNWYILDFDKMINDVKNGVNTYNLFRNVAYTIKTSSNIKNKQLYDWIEEFKTTVNGEIVWKINSLCVVRNYKDNDGNIHVRIYSEPNKFLDISGITPNDAIEYIDENNNKSSSVSEPGTIVAFGEGVVRMGVLQNNGSVVYNELEYEPGDMTNGM